VIGREVGGLQCCCPKYAGRGSPDTRIDELIANEHSATIVFVQNSSGIRILSNMQLPPKPDTKLSFPA